MKKYLLQIDSGHGAALRIAFYADTPSKNYRVYYNGSDTGRRYDRIGNAARYLDGIAQRWTQNGATVTRVYGMADSVPHRGSNA